MSDCLVWHSSVPPQHKLLSCAWSAVTEYKGHLQLKRSTAERDIKTTLLCPTYRSQATELIHWGYDNDINAEHDVEIHNTLLAFYDYTHLC